MTEDEVAALDKGQVIFILDRHERGRPAWSRGIFLRIQGDRAVVRSNGLTQLVSFGKMKPESAYLDELNGAHEAGMRAERAESPMHAAARRMLAKRRRR